MCEVIIVSTGTDNFEIECDLQTTTIGELKELIKKESSMPVKHQRLLYKDKLLCNKKADKTLSEYGMQNGDTITLQGKLDGGGCRTWCHCCCIRLECCCCVS